MSLHSLPIPRGSSPRADWILVADLNPAPALDGASLLTLENLFSLVGVIIAVAVIVTLYRRLKAKVLDVGIAQAALEVERQIAIVADPALHDYAIVDETAHHADAIAFVAEQTAAAAALGFRRVGDLEDRTLTAAHPEARTPLRMLLADDGVVVGVGVRPAQPEMAALPVIEVSAELQDGRFLTWVIMRDVPQLDTAPEIERIRLDEGTALADAVEQLRTRIRAGTTSPVVVPADIDALIQRAHRHHSLEAQARAHLPAGVTRDELARLSKAPPDIVDRVFSILVARKQGSADDVPGPA